MESTTWQISSGFKNCRLWVRLFVFSSWRLAFRKPVGRGWRGQELEGPLPLTSTSWPPRAPSGGPAVGERPCGCELRPLTCSAVQTQELRRDIWVWKGRHC